MATLAYPSPRELEHRRSLRILRYIVTTDHKEIGHLYLIATLVFFVLAGFEALLSKLATTAELPWTIATWQASAQLMAWPTGRRRAPRRDRRAPRA